MCNRCCIPCIRVASITTTATPPTMTHAQFVHELKHAAAAICYALEEMTCSDKEYHKKHHFHKPYPEEYGSKAK